MLHTLMRYYSYLFHLVLSLFVFGVSAVAYLSDKHNMNVTLMPWFTGITLSRVMLALGLVGVVAVFLAFTNKFRQLLPVTSIVAFGLLAWGFFINKAFVFASKTDFQWAIALTAGALGAALCSLMELKREPAPRRRY